MDLHSDFDRFVEIEKQPDNQAPVQPHLPTDSDLPTDLPGQDQNQLIQPDDTSPETDVFNNPLDPVDQTLVRRTRSGKVYITNICDRQRVVRPTWPKSPVYNLLSIYFSSTIYSG